MPDTQLRGQLTELAVGAIPIVAGPRKRGWLSASLRTMTNVLIATLAAGALVAAEAQTKDELAYWDANGDGELTCAEARGRDEGLTLPAYRDNRNGTGVIYE